MTTGLITRSNEDVRIREIGNGFIVSFEGRNRENDWKTVELYFSAFKDACEAIGDFFMNVPKD